MSSRIVYLDWVYETAREQAFDQSEPSALEKEIVDKVGRAISRLTEREQEFARLYWNEGRSVDEMVVAFNKSPHNIESMNRRILRKLRNDLADFVKERFGIDVESGRKCPICSHARRADIERILRAKTERETFRPVYRKLRDGFGLEIRTPQILIGHMKYHMRKEVSSD